MKFDQLTHFYETARQQHIGKAAKILRISPSGISYSIECLERDLDTKLFEKRGKRIFLTESGQRLMDKIPEVQSCMESLRTHVNVDSVSFKGHYRIAASHLLSDILLAPVCGEFLTENPHVSLEVFSLRSAQVIAEVLEQNLDMGVCFSPQDHPKLESVVLHKGQIKVYARKNHPIFKTRNHIQSLSSYKAALPKAFGGIDICETHDVFKKFKIKVDSKMAFDHYGVVTSFLETSDYWSFLPDWVETLPHFSLKPIQHPANWRAPYTINVVWSRSMDMGLRYLLSSLIGT